MSGGGPGPPPLGMMVCNRSVTAKNMPYFGDFQLEFHTSDGNGRIPLGKRLILLCFVVFSVTSLGVLMGRATRELLINHVHGGGGVSRPPPPPGDDSCLGGVWTPP